MKARLYSNENFPLPAVVALRRLGYDVMTTKEAGKAHEGTPDEEVLQFAIAEERAVITHNRVDFIRLHLANPEHFGIVVCTQNPDFEDLANKVDNALKNITDLRCQLLRINRGS